MINKEQLIYDLNRFFPPDVLAGLTAETLFKQIIADIENADSSKPEPDVVFLCDQTACGGKPCDCGVLCKHTHNVEHAINFNCVENINGKKYYMEKRGE